VIPVVDLSGDPARVGRAVDDACRDVGFFTVIGHGVPDAIADEAWATGRAFFELPLAERMSVAMPTPGYPYGYCPLGVEMLARSRDLDTPPREAPATRRTGASAASDSDIKETYAVGPVDAPPRPLDEMADPDERAIYSPNLWPDSGLPQLRPAWEAYYRVMADLAARLMEAFARGLGLPADYFHRFIDRHGSAMRMVNYPHQDRPPPPGALRAGAHTDYGTLTILRQDGAPGGLEVEDAAGRWVPVPFQAGSFVVNVGDLLARWTNDRWRSTLHRVVNPRPDAATSNRRTSFPFFHNANWDARVECLPTCLARGEMPRHPPVLAGAHLMAKFRSTVVAERGR
jgi:isopenicillin N synthase-like dioxygenase